jgi:proteic killer suppression protein
LDIIFQNKDFKDECNSYKLLVRHQGTLRAKKIKNRLDNLAAAVVLEDMRFLPGRCHELTGDRKGQLSLDLDHPWRLIFIPADDPPELMTDGGIDWKNIRAIKILGIEDTHD